MSCAVGGAAPKVGSLHLRVAQCPPVQKGLLLLLVGCYSVPFAFQNRDRKHRTYVYVLIVTEVLEDWEDSVNIGKFGTCCIDWWKQITSQLSIPLESVWKVAVVCPCGCLGKKWWWNWCVCHLCGPGEAKLVSSCFCSNFVFNSCTGRYQEKSMKSCPVWH